MLTYNARQSADSPTSLGVDQVALQSHDLLEAPLVHSCSRLGRSANPPGFSFSEWLRDRRKR